MGENKSTAETGGQPWSQWTRKQAEQIELTEQSVLPVIQQQSIFPEDNTYIWDTWLLRGKNGTVVTLDGWRVAFSLTAPADIPPEDRHDVATIRYYYSRDGREWVAGGEVFDTQAFGHRQWSGSAIYDDGDIHLFYTAVGFQDDNEITHTQRIAGATGGTITTTEETFRLDRAWSHEILLEPDGDYYEREDQAGEIPYTFRDPWFYQDPADGKSYLLFEGNIPLPDGSGVCNGDREAQQYNGCVGLAVSQTGDPLDFELRQPILDSVCLNHELERPHIIHHEDRYYLFVSTHRSRFAPGVEGPDALYGWIANELDGYYEPLNDSGLVLANPAEAPLQAYSWMVYPHQDEFLVQYFCNYPGFAGESLGGILELSENEQSRQFGGTLGSTARLNISGDQTRFGGLLEQGYLPVSDDELVEIDQEPTQ